MIPYILLIIIVVLSTYFFGVQGFFTGLVTGYCVILVIGWILSLLQGGMLPRKVRDETATDFVSKYPIVISQTFKNLSAYEAKAKVETLIDQMFHQAILDNNSIDGSIAGSPQIFIASSIKYSESQPTDELKYLCFLIVDFICSHRLWYGSMNTADIKGEFNVNGKAEIALSMFESLNGTQSEDDLEPVIMNIGQKQVIEGESIAQDCYENGLLNGSPVYLSQIESLIRENFEYMPEAVISGFLNAMTIKVDTGEIVVMCIEGGEKAFVHRDYASDLVSGKNRNK